MAESVYKRAFCNRKAYGLSLFDSALFGYLVFLSRTRFVIPFTTAELADDIKEPYSKVAQSVKKLGEAGLLKKVKIADTRGFMITPEIINNGDNKTKHRKINLWGEI